MFHVLMNASDFVRVFSAVALAASTDETRPHLNAVLVRRGGGTLTVCATNGHWLARYVAGDVHADPIMDDGGGDSLLSREDVLACIKLAKDAIKSAGKYGAAPCVTLNGSFDVYRSVEHATEGQTPIVSRKLAKIDATFPPFEQVIPAIRPARDVAQWFGVAAEYLAVAGKACVIADDDSRVGSVRMIPPTSELDPITFLSRSERLTAIVMPLRENMPSALAA